MAKKPAKKPAAKPPAPARKPGSKLDPATIAPFSHARGDNDAQMAAASYKLAALLGKLGQAAIVTAEAAGSILGRECAAIRVKDGEQRVAARWLFAVLRSSQLRDRAQAAASGATMPRLNIKSLADFTIPMPSNWSNFGPALRPSQTPYRL